MKKIGSVSIKIIYVIMIMVLLLSAVPAQAAPGGAFGQDETPPIPEQVDGAAQPSQLLDDGISQAAAGASISGQITRNGVALVGVTVTGGGQTDITDASGNYILSGFGLGVTVTITPTKAGYIFSPTSQIVTIGNGDVFGINFVSTAVVGFNSQFNGSMAGWTAIHGTQGYPYSWLWGVNSTVLYSPYLGTGGYASIAYSRTSFSNLDYSVRLQRMGCDICASSIFIRGTAVSSLGNWANGYQFSITRNGRYFVAKNINARQIPIKNWTASGAIAKGNAWNVLRVAASGSSLKFYINGNLVWSGMDTSLSTGKVGIGLNSNGTGGVNRMYVDYATLIMP